MKTAAEYVAEIESRPAEVVVSFDETFEGLGGGVRQEIRKRLWLMRDGRCWIATYRSGEVYSFLNSREDMTEREARARFRQEVNRSKN